MREHKSRTSIASAVWLSRVRRREDVYGAQYNSRDKSGIEGRDKVCGISAASGAASIPARSALPAVANGSLSPLCRAAQRISIRSADGRARQTKTFE